MKEDEDQNAGFIKRLLKLPFAKATGLDETDVGTLKVAMFVSALDGHIRTAEFAAFRKMARACKGATPEEVEKQLDKALHAAGYLYLKRELVSRKAFVELFADEALAVLPARFAVRNPRAARRAFATWLTMATCDGDYSDVERACIEALYARFRQRLSAQLRADADRARAHSPVPVLDAEVIAAVKRRVEEQYPADFLARVVAALELLVEPETAVQGERDIAALVG